MFDLFQNANDDQVALMGCFAILFGSGLLMYFSYFLGPVARQERVRHLDSLIRQRQQLLGMPAEKPAHDRAA
jgi:hypothetical protein